MPRGDRTGPMGRGPRTGRGMGDCTGADWPGAAQFGRGFGGGRGWRNWARATGLPRWMRFGGAAPFGAAPTSTDEAGLLQNEAEQLQAELDAIQKRLAELNNE